LISFPPQFLHRNRMLPMMVSRLTPRREGVICNPPAVTRQAQERIALVDGFPDAPSFPIAIDVQHSPRSLHREGREQGRGCDRRHKRPGLDGLSSRAFPHRKARSRLCPRTPRSQRPGPSPSWHHDSRWHKGKAKAGRAVRSWHPQTLSIVIFLP
jgi:hypothetical protein